MSNHNCYLCASDEGILLDIFGDGGKTICGKIEICLSIKIEESNAPSNKICHKCVYELDACSKFVQKYRQARDGSEPRTNPIKGHCCMCSEPGKKGYIFDCKDGDSVNGSLHKIHEIFNDGIFKDKRRNLSICLNCRYNLDVLFDLKSIYQSTPDKLRSVNDTGLKLSELPKTKTRVVSRKTTYTQLPILNGVEVSDTDSSTTSIMPLKRKRGRPRKNPHPVPPPVLRTCKQCENSVENGIDMYRYHRTGRTVCKECWLSINPEKMMLNKRKELGLASGDVGTRRCAVVLKNVLSNPAKFESIYKAEKDEHGNTTFIITDDSSAESDEREKTPAPKRSRKNHGSVTSSESTPAMKTRLTKRTASTKTDLDDEPPAKMKDKRKKIEDDKPSTSTNTKTRNGLAISDTEISVSKTNRRFKEQPADNEKKVKAASDAELTKPPVRKRGRPPKFEKSEPADSSSNETKTAGTTKGRKASKPVAAVVSTSDQVERPVRKTRVIALSTQDAISLSSRLSTLSRNAKPVSEAASPPTRTKKPKTQLVSPKNSRSEVELENPYTCSVCHVEYKNKLVGMEHELTHAKQPEVKLQRVAIPEIVVQDTPAASSLIEEPEEQSHDVSSTSDHRPEDSESVEMTTTVAPGEEASTDVATDTTENKENLEESKRLPEASEAPAEVDDKKDEEEDKAEDKTEAPEATEPEKTVENEKSDDNNVEDAREDETNDTSAITECDKNNDDVETEITTEEAVDSKKAESSLSAKVEKEVESAEPLEKPSEEASQESMETSGNVNGATVDGGADTEVNKANAVEKEADALDCDTESKTIDVCSPEESIDPENVPSVTSTAPETKSQDKDVAKDKSHLHGDETAKNLEGEAKAAASEASIVQNNDTTKSNEESESIVSDVLTEVFDLATAEVQKRLENEEPRDEKCTTPVSETLENISREICNSADMPSLEPLVDDQTSNKQS